MPQLKIPHSATKIPRAAAKTSHSQINKTKQNKLRRSKDEQSEKLEIFNKELENIKKNQIEMKKTITEILKIRQKESTVD